MAGILHPTEIRCRIVTALLIARVVIFSQSVSTIVQARTTRGFTNLNNHKMKSACLMAYSEQCNRIYSDGIGV